MIIILSQKIDSVSSYDGDDAFKVYHYPARYRNQIHTGDIFVYYQGNRYDKSQRYYFGQGRIGEITKEDDENYYAQLVDTKPFEKKVPIYLPDGGYIEQLGFDTVRKSLNPPWQSSIRPLSEEAYYYILKASGSTDDVSQYNEQLKKAIQSYYIEKDEKAVLRILEYAKRIAEIYRLQ